MEQIQEIVEFPVTIPNQRKVHQLIQVASIINVITSLGIGLVTDSLKYLSYSFAAQFVVLVLLIAPNWLFKSEPSLEWISIKM
ncbi:hypothetical protein Cantr_05895 [Candida viswanathii]|uniref:Uncharacterized protein n=1 Tax=Candida viswanathii TaxID=5486 RepID=A0A367XUD6_9ASCO|nr:hypothetical protein Cantr_05895 [Candida viswanathii]